MPRTFGPRIPWNGAIFGAVFAVLLSARCRPVEVHSSGGDPADGGAKPSFAFNTDVATSPIALPGTLVVEPAMVTLKVTDPANPPSQKFTARTTVGGTLMAVSAGWTLDSYDAGDIDQDGVFKARGSIG